MPRTFTEDDFEQTTDAPRTFSEEDFEPGQPETESDAFSSFASNLVDSVLLGGSDQLAGTSEALYKALGGDYSVLENYRAGRDQSKADREQLSAESPTAATVGTYAPLALPAAALGAGAVGAARSLPALSQLPRAAIGAVGGLFSKEALKGAGRGAAGGAGLGAAEGLLSSDADLTRGEVGEALLDAGSSAAVGAGLGAIPGGLIGSRQSSLSRRAAQDARRATAGKQLEDFEAAAEAFRGQQAAAQDAANAAAVAPTRDKALQLTGLEGRASQKKLGGSSRAKAAAEAIFDEPSPSGSGKSILAEGLEKTPEARVEFAKELREAAGKELGALREELAGTKNAFRQKKLVLQALSRQFGEIPRSIQKEALQEVDAVLSSYADKQGRLTPKALRSAIEDLDQLSGFAAANPQTRLRGADSQVYQAARRALLDQERGLFRQYLPAKAAEYDEARRRFGVFKDFATGSEELALRAGQSPGKEPIKYPAAEKVQLPEPEFPGGPEAFEKAQGEFGADISLEQLRIAGGAAGFAIGSKSGSLAIATALRRQGAKAAEKIGEFVAIGRPKAAELERVSAETAAKLAQFTPIYEQALEKGANTAFLTHLLLYEREPDYREAIDSLDRR